MTGVVVGIDDIMSAAGDVAPADSAPQLLGNQFYEELALLEAYTRGKADAYRQVLEARHNERVDRADGSAQND